MGRLREGKSFESRKFRRILILLRARRETGGRGSRRIFKRAHKRRWRRRFISPGHAPGGRARVNRSLDLVEA